MGEIILGEVEADLATLFIGRILGFFDGFCLAVDFDEVFVRTPFPGEDGVLFPVAGRRTDLPSKSAMFRLVLTLADPQPDPG